MNELEKEVMWNKGTEPPFSGKYVSTKDKGTYVCKSCGTELFKSDAKFDSGTGWPSFDLPAGRQAIRLLEDNSYDTRLPTPDAVGNGGQVHRTEVVCKKCRAHLGHVFDDGPTKTGKRYCINSVCLDLVDTKSNRV